MPLLPILASLNQLAAPNRRQKYRENHIALCARVSLLVHLLKPLDARVRINLSRRDRRVPEKLLHRAKVSPGIEKVRSECVAKRVRGKSRVLIDLVEKSLHRVLDRAHGNTPATIAEEERGAIPARTD